MIGFLNSGPGLLPGADTQRRASLAAHRLAELRQRAGLADALAEAIAAAHPADARRVLAAALHDLTNDPLGRCDPVREDARFWSRGRRPLASWPTLSRELARIRTPQECRI
jgi:hypothetical protein